MSLSRVWCFFQIAKAFSPDYFWDAIDHWSRGAIQYSIHVPNFGVIDSIIALHTSPLPIYAQPVKSMMLLSWLRECYAPMASQELAKFFLYV